ncbi:sporulation protein YunB [Desertibacillus haloalkaliphilus]|uniref:sporulation protein YunB n=1 Tax=Desertibacillus haloalkaliphilus TaxID=1328930 RepID=UPI001C273BAF|nr:sporulation protein YunB [Desertibacillus haloalkaliphilus]MBU8906580.1 sporulation protein YunB [Desertibacillus haloalkaliphilus]
MAKFKIHRPRKRKGPLPFRYVFLLSFVIFVAMTVQGLWLVEKGIRPTLIEIAQTETQKIATQAINDAISKKIVDNTGMEDLINIEKDNNDNITSVGFDAQIYNRVVSEAIIRVQKYLKMVEQGQIESLSVPEGVEVDFNEQTFSDNGIIHTIPLGQATNNALLAHLGPQVPVKFTAIGDVKAQLNETIEPSGINNTYISVAMDIEVDVQVVIPFATEEQTVGTTIPIGMIFVPGEVPYFYNHGGDSNAPAPAIIPPDEEEIDAGIN